jgi:hypothetical protein
LKFDTTVIPGSERDSALVDVTVDLEELSHISEYTEEPDKDPSALPTYISDYYRNQAGQNPLRAKTLIYRLDQIYRSWLSDVEQRLNQYSEKLSYLGQTAGSTCLSPKEVAEQALAGVLGERIALTKNVFGTDGAYLGSWPVPLVFPLSSVLRINVSAPAQTTTACANIVRFSVDGVLDQIYHVANKNVSPDYFTANNLYEIGSKSSRLYVQIPDVQSTSFYSYDGDRILKLYKYLATRKMLGLTTLPSVDKPYPPANKSLLPAEYFLIPTGLFNFVERAAKQDLFAYALLPRSELAGYLVDNLTSTAATIEAAGGEGQVGGALRTARALREARATPHTVGFVMAKQGGVEFGWLIDGSQLDQPTQKSHLALVSIPAWISEIKICVRTSWKRSGLRALFERKQTASGAKTDCKQELRVPVPQDMEALDSIIISSTARPPPRIFSQLMDSPKVTACAPASIEVPGEHLWRNTVVTLGGQRANRIIVMPDMRGIVAEFDAVLPISTPAAAEDERLLRIWTTEGSDAATKKIVVLPSPTPSTCQGVRLGSQPN